MARQHTLWMKLNSLNVVLAMPQAHDHPRTIAIMAGGRDFKLCGQRVFFDNQRVVTRSSHRRGDTGKDGSSIVLDLTGFAVHQVRGSDHVTAKGRTNCLMPEADTKNWNLSCELLDHVDTDTRFLWRAW